MGLQQGHLAAGLTDHNLFREGTSHGGVQILLKGLMGMIKKGELARTTMQPGNRPTLVLLCLGHYSCPTNAHRGDGGIAAKGATLLHSPQPYCHPRNSIWMVSRGTSIPHGGSPSLHLGPSSIHGKTGVLRPLYAGPHACQSHHEDSQLPTSIAPTATCMESYTQVPPKCQSV